MERIEKFSQLNELFLTYKSLFTEKQIEYFNYYYTLDYSYQEIADIYGVSRNAIFDALKKVEDNLYLYEENLQIIKRRNERKTLIEKYLETKDIKYLEALQRMDE